MNGKLKNVLGLLMVVAMLITAVMPVAAAPTSSVYSPAEKAPEFKAATATPVSAPVIEPKGATGPAIYIVELTDAPLATYRGGVTGLEATSAAARGEAKLNAKSAASNAYLGYLAGERASAISAASEALGRDIDVAYEYKAALNGFSAEMTPAEARKVAALPGVLRITRDREFELQTDHGPAWIGATGIWDGSATGGAGTYGEGVIVGVIDTGIDPWNPSFADVGGDGYDHTNPWGEGNYVGVCDPGDPSYDDTFPCNDKLIGAWGYASVNGGDPRNDDDGHGSHTTSTAAGNFVMDATVTTPTGSWSADISGVAPHANIVMYAACCTGSALSGARDQVVLDGVDAVNYSIGSSAPTGDPWNDTYAQQWLAVREAGIFVATSNGNAGPGDATVGSPADLPWMTSVGASSHDRAFLNSMTVDDGVNGPLTVSGQSMTGPLDTPTKVVRSIDFADPDNGISEVDANLCADGIFPPGTFNGEIVICERGVYGRVAKGQTVADGGAGGYILAQPNEFGGGPGAVTSDPHVIPAVHIDYYQYQDLLNYLDNAAGDVMGTIAGSTIDVDDAYGNIMAAFSSRGPNGGYFADLIVPNVTAPGRAIWAAYHHGPGGDGDYTYNVIQGTSMSSPHVAGAGALMVAVHPDWTPAEIESALMSTADSAVLNDDGMNPATPFAQGSGNVQLGAAAQAGLVLDVAIDDFQASDPRAGGDPKTLNIASMGNDNCVGACGWTRTVKSTMDSDMDWTATVMMPDGTTGTVEPAAFTLAAGGTQELTVNVDVLGMPEGEWVFGEVLLEPVVKAASAAHLPIAVAPSSGDVPEFVDIVTRRDAGSQMVKDLVAIEISDLTVETFGLAKADQHDFSLPQDPTNGDPYDNLDDVWWMTFNIGEGVSRMVAEIPASTAPDMDLFWGSGTEPSAASQLGASTTSSFVEYLNANDPPAGDYWVLAQTWNGSGAPADDTTVLVGVVGGDAGNMMVDGPAAVPGAQPFDLTVSWNDDMMAGDVWYGAFTLGTDAANPGNIATVNVDLARLEDDVTKYATVNDHMRDNAIPGDTITYVIEVLPNVTPTDLTYVVTDTLPAGVTYVEGSAMASAGEAAFADGVFTWTGVMETPIGKAGGYAMTTSADDPMCDTPFGGYVDLEAFGLMAQPDITGDTSAWTAFTSGDPISFYGMDYSGMSFTDDGFGIFDVDNNYGGSPWIAQAVPNADAPNNVIAPMWEDFEIFYDEALNYGVSLATAGSPGGVVLVEYDDVQFWGGSADTFDFEIIAARAVDNTPGAYEIALAYDNLNGDLSGPLTIGVENAAGDDGTALVNAGSADGVISDGFVVCFDYTGPSFDPVYLSYEVVVDPSAMGTDLVNEAVHNTDNPGSMAAVSSVTITVPEPTVSHSKRFDVDRDTFIDGGRPDSYYGDASTMWVGFEDLQRPVVHTPIDSIPFNAAVDTAYLYLYVAEGRGFGGWNGSVLNNVSAHAITTPWMPVGANWNTPWTAAGGDYGVALDGTHLGSGKVGTWLRFDVTDAVAPIIPGDAENLGFILTSDGSQNLKAADALTSVRYGLATKEYWDASKTGYLRIMYRTYQ